MQSLELNQSAKSVRQAYIWVNIFGIPFFSIFEVFIFILLKELDASTMQITAALSLRPISALLSPYWSSVVHNRLDLLRHNLLWANILRYSLFLFFPWFTNVWLFIISIAIYWAITKGMTPAWMELIKTHIPKGYREKLCSKGLNINYLGKLCIPMGFGILLDKLAGSWMLIFPLTAMVGILSSVFIYRLPIFASGSIQKKDHSLKELIKRPWVDSKKLLSVSPDFLKFQLGFFLGGAGLMLIQPAISQFFVKELSLSYTAMTAALTMMKGIGFVAASSIWIRKLQNLHIFEMCGRVTFLAFLFPLMILLAKWNVSLVYIAYFFYGIMQSGSELTWHMSGPVFADKNLSAVYSTTNLLSVGLRGVIFPYLGAFLFVITSTVGVLLSGSLLISAGAFLFWLFTKESRSTSTLESS